MEEAFTMVVRPPKYDCEEFGSNQNLAVEVAEAPVAPIAITSVVLRE